ncbi:MAG: hypothetical protein KF836_09475 [Fimbriimonadaceae bacterium]|nr:hypothetical protein [Fimbriimonadaceae bacterium]
MEITWITKLGIWLKKVLNWAVTHISELFRGSPKATNSLVISRWHLKFHTVELAHEKIQATGKGVDAPAILNGSQPKQFPRDGSQLKTLDCPQVLDKNS